MRRGRACGMLAALAAAGCLALPCPAKVVIGASFTPARQAGTQNAWHVLQEKLFRNNDSILRDLSDNSQKWQEQLKKGGSANVLDPASLVECSNRVDGLIIALQDTNSPDYKGIDLTWLRTTLDEEVWERAKAEPGGSALQEALLSIMPRIVDSLLAPGNQPGHDKWDETKQGELKALLAEWKKVDKDYLAKLVEHLGRDERKWQRLLTMGGHRKWAETCADLPEDRALTLLAAMQESKSKDCRDFGALLLRQLAGYHQGSPDEVKQAIKWAAGHPEMFHQVMGMMTTANNLSVDDIREIVPSLLSVVEHQGCSVNEMQELLKQKPFLLFSHPQLYIYEGIPADDGYKLRGIYADILLGMIAPGKKNFTIDEVRYIVKGKTSRAEKLVRIAIVADAHGIDTVCPWRTQSATVSMQKMTELLCDIAELQYSLEQQKSDMAPVLLALNAVLHAPLYKNVGTIKNKDTAQEIRTYISKNIYEPLVNTDNTPPTTLGRLWAAAKDDMAKYGVLQPAAGSANAKQSRS